MDGADEDAGIPGQRAQYLFDERDRTRRALRDLEGELSWRQEQVDWWETKLADGEVDPEFEQALDEERAGVESTRHLILEERQRLKGLDARVEQLRDRTQRQGPRQERQAPVDPEPAEASEHARSRAAEAGGSREPDQSRPRGFLLVEGCLGPLLFLVSAMVFFGASTGVVYENCADLDRPGEVDSHWTYILWPPIFFANIDPAGTCVRNAPLRQGLDAVGVWNLPSGAEQVRDHLESQQRIARHSGGAPTRDRSSSDSGSASAPAQTTQAEAYAIALNGVFSSYAAHQSTIVKPGDPTATFKRAIALVMRTRQRIAALQPPTKLGAEQQRMLALLDREAVVVKGERHAYLSGDQATFETLLGADKRLTQKLNRTVARVIRAAGGQPIP